MITSIMQPYIFPYIGYFHLVNAADTFIFYDDVNFIKRGWINRNKILLGNKEHLMSFPCIKASQNKLIKDVHIDMESQEYSKLLIQIELAYKKAPFFRSVFPIIESVFNSKCDNISELSSLSIISIAQFLDIETNFMYSSKNFSNSFGINRADRLIQITKELESSKYVNAAGGVDLYDKGYFKEQGVDLYFLESKFEQYEQFNDNFIPGLSIIDVLMFNHKSEIYKMLNTYKLR